MEVDKAACFIRLTVIFATNWDCAMWSPYRSELDFVDRVYLVFGDSINTEDLEVFTAFIVEILLPTKMQIWKLFEESRDGLLEVAAAPGPWDLLPSHCYCKEDT